MDKIFALATAILMTVLFAVSAGAVFAGYTWHLATMIVTAVIAAAYYVEYQTLKKA